MEEVHRLYAITHSLCSGLAGIEKAPVDPMLEACGMAGVLSIKLDRQITRADNLEVWQA